MLHEGGIRDGQVFVKLLTNRAACHLSLARPLKALQDCTMAVQVCTVVPPCLPPSASLLGYSYFLSVPHPVNHPYPHPCNNLSIHASVHQPIHASIHPPMNPSICPSHHSTDPSSRHSFIHPSILPAKTHASIHRLIQAPSHPSIHPSTPTRSCQRLACYLLWGRRLSCLLARLFQAGLACSFEVRQLLLLPKWCIMVLILASHAMKPFVGV